jgi:uncharacterized protein
MSDLPDAIAAFLAGKRIAVAGVSRDSKGHVGNAVFRKLRDGGYEVFAVNPNASEVEGVRCYPALGAIAGELDGVVVATPPSLGVCIVRQCAEKGVKRIWFHRSFGQGSVSDEALAAAHAAGIETIEGGCPLMYIAPVDGGHKCLRWLLKLMGKIPG